MSEWKPIETAPKDGTPVDLWHETYGRITDTWWDEDDGFWVTGAGDQGLITHWAPLTAPEPTHNPEKEE